MSSTKQTGSRFTKTWIGGLVAGFCLTALGYFAIDVTLWCADGLSGFSPSYRDRGMLSDSAGNFWALIFSFISDILSAVLLLIPIALISIGCFFILMLVQHRLLILILSVGAAAMLIAVFYQLLDGSMRFSYWDQIEYVWPVIKQTIYFTPLFLGTVGALFAVLVMSGDSNQGDDGAKEAKNNEAVATVGAFDVLLLFLTPIVLISILVYHFQDKIRHFQHASTTISCCGSEPAAHPNLVMASQSPKLRRLFVEVNENGSQLQSHLDLAMQNKNMKEIRLEYKRGEHDKTALKILSGYPLRYAGIAYDSNIIIRDKSIPTSINNSIVGISIEAVEGDLILSPPKISPYGELKKLKGLRHIEFNVGLVRHDRQRQLLSYLLGPDTAKIETLALNGRPPFHGHMFEQEYVSIGSKMSGVKRLVYKHQWDTDNADILKGYDRYVSKILKPTFPSLQEVIFFVHRNNVGKYTYEPLREIIERHGIRCIFVKESYPQSLEVLFETNWADFNSP